MAYYKPCKNCAADPKTCKIRQRMKMGIAGLHVTSINFLCRERESMFRPGQRVSFPWSHYEMNDWGDTDENRLIFSGTVVCENGLKFVVRVDDKEGAPADDESEPMQASMVFRNENLMTKVRPVDMTALSEFDAAICQSCAAYPGEKKRCHGYGKPGHWDCYWPTECVNKPATQKEKG